MKSEPYTLISEEVRDNLFKRLLEIPLDGKTRVTIADAKGKRSEAINRLMWMWYGEIQVFLRESGQGIYSTDDIHEFMINLLLPRKMVAIRGQYRDIRAHTSKMNNKEMANYLDLLDHYAGSELGLSLTHPIDLFNEAMKR
jgi:hypothetical protein